MKFLVIDDHALTREGIRLALSRLGDDVTVQDAASVKEALASIEENPDLDLALLDLRLPDASGFTLLSDLRRLERTVPVVVVSASDDRDQVLKAFELGALGFIPKSAPIEVMVHAIRLVLAGGSYIPPQVLRVVRDPPPAERPNGRGVDGLTDRQRQILALMARGNPNKAISDELEITEATVKAHITEIFRVLGVNNRTQAVIVAGDLGIR